MAEDRPMIAEETDARWRAWPSDQAERRKLRHELAGWKLSKDRTRLLSPPVRSSIARDSEGRVLRTAWSGEDYAEAVTYEQKVLCDPDTETVTWLNGPDSVPVHPLPDGQVLEKPNIETLSWKTTAFNPLRWGPGNNGLKLVDLGYREIDGVRAHGRRWLLARNGSFSSGDFKELWVSEDLKLDVLFIEQDLDEGRGARSEMTSLRLAEPDPKLFQTANGTAARERDTFPVRVQLPLADSRCCAAGRYQRTDGVRESRLTCAHSLLESR